MNVLHSSFVRVNGLLRAVFFFVEYVLCTCMNAFGRTHVRSGLRTTGRIKREIMIYTLFRQQVHQDCSSSVIQDHYIMEERTELKSK